MKKPYFMLDPKTLDVLQAIRSGTCSLSEYYRPFLSGALPSDDGCYNEAILQNECTCKHRFFGPPCAPCASRNAANRIGSQYLQSCYLRDL